MKNLILIEKGDYIQFDDIEELVKRIIDEDYYNCSDDEKRKLLELKATFICDLENIPIVCVNDLKEIRSFDDIKNKFIIYDEITFILSMLNLGRWFLLERKDANILAKDIKVDNMQDNYIILNTYTDKLLREYIGV